MFSLEFVPFLWQFFDVVLFVFLLFLLFLFCSSAYDEYPFSDALLFAMFLLFSLLL
ncbi:hypothetical protein RUMGNA_02617 [Mediterraneibacter gnavus ATCC 29149]|uniref:ATP-binding protein n=1 Tax=Mediterraneibacter gnavus (strain ATCC 29149 / DSM 114966 / JCM 6515 / VPI C7-9) TaxID=411470 RepID=A7B4Y1_MEDG7|nr:hypothetical protein RUMGNA_02617 [Mediterraneibacter gnavus ATCC 29149]